MHNSLRGFSPSLLLPSCCRSCPIFAIAQLLQSLDIGTKMIRMYVGTGSYADWPPPPGLLATLKADANGFVARVVTRRSTPQRAGPLASPLATPPRTRSPPQPTCPRCLSTTSLVSRGTCNHHSCLKCLLPGLAEGCACITCCREREQQRQRQRKMQDSEAHGGACRSLPVPPHLKRKRAEEYACVE